MNKTQEDTASSKLAQREKTWNESSVDEKLEKIRNEIRGLVWQLDALNRLSSDIDKLMKHEHGAKGEVMVKIERNYGSIGLERNSRLPLQ